MTRASGVHRALDLGSSSSPRGPSNPVPSSPVPSRPVLSRQRQAASLVIPSSEQPSHRHYLSSGGQCYPPGPAPQVEIHGGAQSASRGRGDVRLATGALELGSPWRVGRGCHDPQHPHPHCKLQAGETGASVIMRVGDFPRTFTLPGESPGYFSPTTLECANQQEGLGCPHRRGGGL